MGDMTLDLNQSPININFNFNVSFDGRWLPNGHLTVEFSVRWVNAFKGGAPRKKLTLMRVTPDTKNAKNHTKMRAQRPSRPPNEGPKADS